MVYSFERASAAFSGGLFNVQKSSLANDVNAPTGLQHPSEAGVKAAWITVALKVLCLRITMSDNGTKLS